MAQQIALFQGLRGGDYDDLKPFEKMNFPVEFVAGLEALFRADDYLASNNQLKSDVVCPHRVGKDLYAIPLPNRQLRLFGDAEPAPVELMCDCPRARSLLMDLGKRLPPCSKNRCPVRTVLQENT